MPQVRRPLVSIGFPVFNGELSMRKALDSLIRQSYENLEIVISDNASTDRTQEICLEYARKNPRIRYHRNVTNIGVTANLRRVLELASGEYFMWACHDDLRPANAVESCFDALQQAANRDAVMAHGPILFSIPGHDALTEVINPPMPMSHLKPHQRIRIFSRNIRQLCIVYGLHKRAALQRAFLSAHLGQEYILCLQLLLQGSFVSVDAPMIVYSLRKQGVNKHLLYEEVPLTWKSLLTTGPTARRKCWTVLLLGCHYLLKAPGASRSVRLRAVITHGAQFLWLYKRHLSREIVFQFFFPLSFLTCIVWNAAKAWPKLAGLTRRFKLYSDASNPKPKV